MKKVLVIDDESSIRQVLQIHLNGAGYEVVTAESAMAGLGLVCEEIGLVICDYHLPDMTGLEVVRAIRSEHSGMPVLLITGFLDDRLHGEASASGAADLLRKPFQKSELLEVVKGVLSSKEERV